MKFQIYMSAAIKLMTEEELLEILTISRDNNKAKGITGMLLYCEGSFVQVIEGEDEAVDALYNKIRQDKRHYGIIDITTGAISERNFPEWSMGFKSVNRDELNYIKGFIDPMSPEFLKQDKKHSAIYILQTFARTNGLSS